MSKKPRRLDIRESRAYCAAVSALTGFLVIMGCLFVFSALLARIDAPAALIAVMSTVALCVGAYSGGFVSAKKRRKNGMLCGIITGAVMFTVIFLISIFFAKTAISLTAASKLVLTLLFGAVGGVVGVNSRRGKY